MTNERRRFFRITDRLGITYKVIPADTHTNGNTLPGVDIFDLLTETDAKINRLLLEVAEESPKVAALVSAFNQKLERITNQMMLETRLVERIAHRVQEVNISACGLAFSHDEPLPAGTLLALELHLLPKPDRVVAQGILVDCRPLEDGSFYWRIDFADISPPQQELLIQHMLQRQRQLLRERHNPLKN